MSEEKRVVFSFDKASYDILEEMTKNNFGSMGETVRDSLAINKSLQTQSDEGFKEVIVRNPRTGEERIMRKPKF